MKNISISGKTYDRIFDLIVYTFMFLISFITLYPFWSCLVGSLNEGLDFIKGGVFFYPRKFTLENYVQVLRDKRIISAYGVTVSRTIITTISHLLFTSIFAYAYSRRILKGKRLYMVFCLIPMYFGGGLIPVYILYKQLNLLNNFTVYVIPALLSFWNAIILRTFFKDNSIDAITECAMVDGANEYMIYWKIVMPLAKPILAAIALFVGVGQWNSYYDTMMFTTVKELKTIQVFLMDVIREQQRAASMVSEAVKDDLGKSIINIETIKRATMMVATLPILILYPFLQKYFVKGVMIGSLKG